MIRPKKIKPKKLSAGNLRKQRNTRVLNGRKDIKENKNKQHDLLVPSGSIMFNLACSDRYEGAYIPGTMINIVGDSSAGKSFLVLSGLAECANNPLFDDYDLIYDDSEHANSFNMVKLFGTKFVERLQGPNINDPTNFSTTIEQFGDFIFARIESGKPFIYVEDSFDSLDAEDEIKKDKENRQKRKDGKETKGSFNATKQKKASSLFRQICSGLKKTKSNLIVVSQTRDNLNAMSFATKYRAGGKALKFYSHIEAWLTYIGSIDKIVNGKKYRIGVNTRGKIEKNKITGKKREPEFPIYYNYGIDDISACLDFLTKNKVYQKKGNQIIADSLKLQGTRKKFISEVERLDLQNSIFQDTQKCWNDIENSLKEERKGKFK